MVETCSTYEEVTYQDHQVVCEEPRIILSPLAPELVARYGNGCIAGRPFSFSTMRRRKFMREFPRDFFSVHKNGITRADLHMSFVVDPFTGEQFPLYIEVPCNHCAICKDRKRQSMVQRCKLETLCYDTMPWFVTLTYAPRFLPSLGASKRDLQLFMKRFRINLERSGYRPKIRYICCAEYGSPKYTQRPHYHLVLWNLPAYGFRDSIKVRDCLDKSWSYGRVQSRAVRPEDDKTIYYTTKYLFKGTDTPVGKKPTFFLASNRHGGIGSRFLDAHGPEIIKTMNTNFKYLNIFSGKISNLVFDQYVLNRILPSYSRSIPSFFRSSLQEFSRVVNCLKSRGKSDIRLDSFLDKYKDYQETYFQAVFDPYRHGVPVTCTDGIPEGDDVYPYLESLVNLIDRCGPRVDFSKAFELSNKRNLFLYKLFRYARPVDIGERAYQARKRYGLGKACERL